MLLTLLELKTLLGRSPAFTYRMKNELCQNIMLKYHKIRKVFDLYESLVLENEYKYSKVESNQNSNSISIISCTTLSSNNENIKKTSYLLEKHIYKKNNNC